MSAERGLNHCRNPPDVQATALVKGLAHETRISRSSVSTGTARSRRPPSAPASTAPSCSSAARIGGGAILGAASLLGAIPGAAFASSKGSVRAASDVDILNFALTLEYLEAAFYAEALKKGALKGPTLAFAKVVAKDEAQHVAFLKTRARHEGREEAEVRLQGHHGRHEDFQSTAIVLEDTGVSAYAGAAPMISNKKTLSAALSVHSVEARHAAWIRNIVGMNPAPCRSTRRKTKAQVLKIVTGTGFITG